MAESHVISALKAKQEEIKKRISALKKEIKARRNELETVTKVMRMFEATPGTEGNRLFKRGTVSRLIFDALRANPEGLDTHQLAAVIIKEEGFDANDPEMAATIRQRCMMAMYRYIDRGQVVKELRGPAKVWRLA
jgi:hypothetical protein